MSPYSLKPQCFCKYRKPKIVSESHFPWESAKDQFVMEAKSSIFKLQISSQTNLIIWKNEGFV